MTTQTEQSDAEAPGTGNGLGALIVPAILAIASTLVVIGNLTMDVQSDDSPGPTFFPWLLAIAGYALAVALAVQFVRNPDELARSETKFRTYTDWMAAGWLVGGLVAFAVLLDVLGWILAAALLFWCVTRAFNSKRPLLDVSAGLLLSSAVFLIFGVLLDVPLPSGILGGL
ncbi:Tricarboxylate transport protein TctB [Tsukamurella pulmonis]|uniref:tripartite tricarboxylate transporter TctB family protein n=1 Tax=Tsukamurella pulmonis TaxID=47312 RepID=UPI0007916CE4|nr:tripartite tricarboxylate transporter TctB family protein [Tsukamurella pulmonis]KXP09880.1 Tricarboxylate transport protein TctB [Tsukamurella pulmonis]RDH13520.1 tripartite tricarboxylate transporter TctB family protein [Tsukamurella pulmonis]